MIKKLIILLGLILGLDFAGFFYQAWLVAYLSPAKANIITVNTYGEARFELYAFPVAFIIMIACVVILILEIRKDVKSGGENEAF